MISEPERGAASTTKRADCERGDQSVALREVGGAGRRAERPFRHDRAVRGDLVGECAVPRRIDEIGAGRDHRDRARPAVEPATMCGGIDPEREARHDRQPGVGQLACEVRCVGEPLRRGVTTADHGETARVQQVEPPLYI